MVRNVYDLLCYRRIVLLNIHLLIASSGWNAESTVFCTTSLVVVRYDCSVTLAFPLSSLGCACRSHTHFLWIRSITNLCTKIPIVHSVIHQLSLAGRHFKRYALQSATLITLQMMFTMQWEPHIARFPPQILFFASPSRFRFGWHSWISGNGSHYGLYVHSLNV